MQQWAELAQREGVTQVALISDASTSEIDRMNARAQHLRAERGELGEQEVRVPGVAYGVREGDRVAFIAQHHPEGERRVENGTRGQITHVDLDQGQVNVLTDGARKVTLTGDELETLRLAYAQHLYRQQGATVQRAVVLTGGWQTSQEGAYVQASRARHGTDWHIAREDLGTEGLDPERIGRLSELMRASRAQLPSLALRAITPDRSIDVDMGEELQRSTVRQLAPGHGLDRDAGIGAGL